MIGANVCWVYLAPQNIPRATVLTLGNNLIKLYILYCTVVQLYLLWGFSERQCWHGKEHTVDKNGEDDEHIEELMCSYVQCSTPDYIPWFQNEESWCGRKSENVLVPELFANDDKCLQNTQRQKSTCKNQMFGPWTCVCMWVCLCAFVC